MVHYGTSNTRRARLLQQHCAYCDNCVEIFDHHCPWVGTCIGRRNYRYFAGLLMASSMYATYIAAVSIVLCIKGTLRQLDEDNGHTEWSGLIFGSIKSNIHIMILVILVLLLDSFIISLVGYHMFLISIRQTTNEHLKVRWSRHTCCGIREHNPATPQPCACGCLNRPSPYSPPCLPLHAYDQGRV